VHISIVNLDAVHVLAGRVNHTVLARLVAALYVDLRLLKLQAVMAEIQLV
jgi:hypothetical protein